ncbi:triadin-like isoform X2 [Syngnathoides biaculeatus]|uniref:triadin-like isoform X2 n=1 Tax=Syngnathoides biaculeatus TaxID=300417 RepID=UPI002ADD7A66|nr:triadin-like isoform X2 [Syngnathoides biaculeatus]
MFSPQSVTSRRLRGRQWGPRWISRGTRGSPRRPVARPPSAETHTERERTASGWTFQSNNLFRLQYHSLAELPSPPMRSQTSGADAAPPPPANQKTVLDDVILTFSSPMAWLLVAALVITWTAVAVVLFDLLDYKTLAGLPPPAAIARRGLKAGRGARSSAAAAAAGAAPPPPQEGTDWLELLWTFAASLVAPDEEDEEEAAEDFQQLTETFARPLRL